MEPFVSRTPGRRERKTGRGRLRWVVALNVLTLTVATAALVRTFTPIGPGRLSSSARAQLHATRGPRGVPGRPGPRGGRGARGPTGATGPAGTEADESELSSSLSVLDARVRYLCGSQLLVKPSNGADEQWLSSCP